MSYLQAVLLEGAGDTRVFGMRVQSESLSDLSKRLKVFYPEELSDSNRFYTAFSTSHYIHLSREDKIAQAVSLLKAEQSGLWHIHADGKERERLKKGHVPVYDFKVLSNLVTELEEHDAAWKAWFNQEKIQPLSITYEALCAKPLAVLTDVLSYLNLDATKVSAVEPKTAKLASSESCEWAELFRAEQLNQSR